MLLSAIDHVQVAAPPGCEGAARAFYGDLLGLDEIAKPAELAGRGGCWFGVGGQQLHVGVEDSFAPARKAHPGFVADDLAALRARLEGAGIAVQEDETLPGLERFFAADPFGNRLEFRQR